MKLVFELIKKEMKHTYRVSEVKMLSGYLC